MGEAKRDLESGFEYGAPCGCVGWPSEQEMDEDAKRDSYQFIAEPNDDENNEPTALT